MSLNGLDPNRLRAASGVSRGATASASRFDDGQFFDTASWSPLPVATRVFSERSWAASSSEDDPPVSEVIVVKDENKVYESGGRHSLLGFAKSMWDDLWKWGIAEPPHVPDLADLNPTDGPTDWDVPDRDVPECAGMKTPNECEVRDIFIRFLESMEINPLLLEAIRLERLGDPRAVGVRLRAKPLQEALARMRSDWEACCTGPMAPKQSDGCNDDLAHCA